MITEETLNYIADKLCENIKISSAFGASEIPKRIDRQLRFLMRYRGASHLAEILICKLNKLKKEYTEEVE